MKIYAAILLSAGLCSAILTAQTTTVVSTGTTLVQSTGTTTIAAIAAPLPLDQVTGEFAAYSVSRKLAAGYAGQCCRIIRGDNNAETDIGFSGNDINSAAIASHCAGTDGYVVTIYDQTGNSRSITNATSTQRPKIYSSGTGVETGSNGKVKIVFDGTDDALSGAGFTFGGAGASSSYHIVARNTGFTSNDFLIALGSSTRCSLRQFTGPVWRLNSGSNLDGPSYTLNQWYFVSTGWDTTTNENISVNNGVATNGPAGANGPNNVNLGHPTTGAQFDFHELIVFDHAWSTGDNSTLFANADSYYNLP